MTATKYSHLKVGRNDTCPCGSGKKYKKCCIHEPYTPSPELEEDILLGQQRIQEHGGHYKGLERVCSEGSTTK